MTKLGLIKLVFGYTIPNILEKVQQYVTGMEENNVLLEMIKQTLNNFFANLKTQISKSNYRREIRRIKQFLTIFVL